MTVQELKKAVEGHRESLKGTTGKTVTMSETGPVGISIIDSIVKVLEAQDRRIEELERKA